MIFAAILLAFQIVIPHVDVQLPPLEVTTADIVAVLAEYSLIHEDNPTFCKQFYGLTDFDTKSISLCSRYDSARMRRTLLHEILHILYYQKGIMTGGPFEVPIDAQAEQLYLKFYGMTPVVGQPLVEQIQD
mgnify:CR=1 FL=1